MKTTPLLLLAAILLYGCALNPSIAYADDSVVGRTYWLSHPREARYMNVSEGVRWIKIIGDSKTNHYDVELSNGEHDMLRKDWVNGWISGQSLLTQDPVEKEKLEAKKAAEQAGIANARRAAKIKAKKWPASIETLVLKRQVVLGMTEEQVTLAIGKPTAVNRSVGSWGIHEQWVYGGRYLYFENGVLKSWQD